MDAGRGAGFTESMCRVARDKIETPAMREVIERMRIELVENAVEEGLIDAAEIHEYLTDAVRAQMSDIRNDDGSFRPISEWPAIWQRMVEGGDVEVETSSERSHDGQTKDKAGGWDVAGTVTKVKYRFGPRHKWVELAMRHKAVDAMIQPRSDVTAVAVVSNTVVNLAQVCTMEQLEELRRLAQTVVK